VTRRAQLVAWAGLAIIAIAFIAVRYAIPVTRPFFDAYTPPQPYNWVSPPPAFRQGNQPPSGGKVDIPFTNGSSDPASAFTEDGQVTVSFNVGTFSAQPGQTAVRLGITPVSPQPKTPHGLVADGNAYRVDATYVPGGSPASAQLPVLLDLRYPIPQPDAIYRIDGATWMPIGGTVQILLLTIDARSSTLGTFITAYQAAAPPPSSSLINPITLGIVVLGIFALVLIAGVRIRRPR
jgi:hypothetical protein